MTGFATAQGGDDLARWSWELRSVNGRNLDIRCRLPVGYEGLEPRVRKTVAALLSRGHVTVGLTIEKSQTPRRVFIDETLIDAILESARPYIDDGRVAAPRLDGLLRINGTLVIEEENLPTDVRTARGAAIIESLESCLAAMLEFRQREGEDLRALAVAHVRRIAGLAGTARDLAACQPQALRQRLGNRLAEALDAGAAIDSERLEQEIAHLALKADVTEELDRLEAHATATVALLEKGGVIGRKLDFLAQEFAREANTLCAKSADLELTRLGIDLKSTIDQLREQIQNIE